MVAVSQIQGPQLEVSTLFTGAFVALVVDYDGWVIGGCRSGRDQ
jgi:hypothetical protein